MRDVLPERGKALDLYYWEKGSFCFRIQVSHKGYALMIERGRSPLKETVLNLKEEDLRKWGEEEKEGGEIYNKIKERVFGQELSQTLFGNQKEGWVDLLCKRASEIIITDGLLRFSQKDDR